jgi:hypothetical protein
MNGQNTIWKSVLSHTMTFSKIDGGGNKQQEIIN